MTSSCIDTEDVLIIDILLSNRSGEGINIQFGTARILTEAQNIHVYYVGENLWVVCGHRAIYRLQLFFSHEKHGYSM